MNSILCCLFPFDKKRRKKKQSLSLTTSRKKCNAPMKHVCNFFFSPIATKQQQKREETNKAKKKKQKQNVTRTCQHLAKQRDNEITACFKNCTKMQKRP